MWIKQLLLGEKEGSNKGKLGGVSVFYKRLLSLLEVIPSKDIWFPRIMAQNKAEKVIHLSTPLIVITSIYI